jgi:hypothetical protein
MIAPEVKKLTDECADLSVRMGNRMSKLNCDFLIWASPVCARNYDGSWLWHPRFLNKGVFYKLSVLFYSLFRYSLSGIRRFFTYRGFTFKYEKRDSSMLLIMPMEITGDLEKFKTSYLIEDENHPVDKIVFSQSKSIGERYSALSLYFRFKMTVILLYFLLNDLKYMLFTCKINSAYLVSFTLMIRWILSQGWFFHWDFYSFLDALLSSGGHKYRLLISLHEMYFYSRSIWKLANKHQLIGVTAQHALIVPERFLWFRHSVEIEAGCPEPDLFFVYNDWSKDLFQPYYKRTKFQFCCSPRFSHWKSDHLITSRCRSQDQKDVILFMGSSMFLDTVVLLRAIQRLLCTEIPRFATRGFARDDRPEERRFVLRLRFHPHARILNRDRRWIDRASMKGVIEISRHSLKEDLEHAALVIGCNSAALPECILLGIPTLSVFDPDVICPSMIEPSHEWEVSAREISWGRVFEQMKKVPSPAMIETFRQRMGFYHEDLTTAVIHEATARI